GLRRRRRRRIHYLLELRLELRRGLAAAFVRFAVRRFRIDDAVCFRFGRLCSLEEGMRVTDVERVAGVRKALRLARGDEELRLFRRAARLEGGKILAHGHAAPTIEALLNRTCTAPPLLGAMVMRHRQRSVPSALPALAAVWSAEMVLTVDAPCSS